jgi:hypothetical protein
MLMKFDVDVEIPERKKKYKKVYKKGIQRKSKSVIILKSR